MKNQLKFIVLALSALCICYGTQQVLKQTSTQTSDSYRPLILDTQNNPNVIVKALALETGVAHDGTLGGLVKATQQEQPTGWIRKAGQERWQLESYYQQKSPSLLPLFEKLNYLQEIKPRYTEYDYVVIMGALTSRVRTRTLDAINQWKNGIRFKQVVFLTGARKLDPVQEDYKTLVTPDNADIYIRKDWTFDGNLPTTETEMAKFVYNQLELPKAFAEIPVTFIDAPLKIKADGTTERPNSGDTVAAWLATGAKPGRVLVISNQPYVGYQDSVARTLLPKSFDIDTIGTAASSRETAEVLLDTLARHLYQENKRLQTP